MKILNCIIEIANKGVSLDSVSYERGKVWGIRVQRKETSNKEENKCREQRVKLIRGNNKGI